MSAIDPNSTARIPGTLRGRHALVTGGARGIGFAIARALAESGAAVVISDIDEEAGNEAAALIAASGGTVRSISCDVSSDDDTTTLIEEASKSGMIDILVNNAGIISRGDTIDIDVLEWDRLFAVNVRSVFLITRKLMPAMIAAQRGRIVHIASVAAQVGGGFLGNSCYAATKGAVISFSKGLAREGGPHNVTSNVVCPGFIDTPLTQQMDDDLRHRALANIPMHRPASPDEIAGGVLFLASDLGSYVNGVTLNIDGGLIRF